MDSAKDRFIEIGNSIYNKKYNTLAIFEFAKEDRNQLIASDILRWASFYIYICLVQKNKGIPVIGGLKDTRKLNFYRSWIEA